MCSCLLSHIKRSSSLTIYYEHQKHTSKCMQLHGEIWSGEKKTLGSWQIHYLSILFKLWGLMQHLVHHKHNCLQITWRECYWAYSTPNLSLLWTSEGDFVLILFSFFYYSPCCWEQLFQGHAAAVSQEQSARGHLPSCQGAANLGAT